MSSRCADLDVLGNAHAINSCRPTRSAASLAVRSLHASRLVRDEKTSATEQQLSPKLATIVDSISGLTLLEVSELVSALKVSHGIKAEFSFRLDRCIMDLDEVGLAIIAFPNCWVDEWGIGPGNESTATEAVI